MRVRPNLVLLCGIGVAFICGGIATCIERSPTNVNAARFWTGNDNQPMDHPGWQVVCPECPDGWLRNEKGHRYRCNRCDVTMEVRRKPDSGGYTFKRLSGSH